LLSFHLAAAVYAYATAFTAPCRFSSFTRSRHCFCDGSRRLRRHVCLFMISRLHFDAISRRAVDAAETERERRFACLRINARACLEPRHADSADAREPPIEPRRIELTSPRGAATPAVYAEPDTIAAVYARAPAPSRAAVSRQLPEPQPTATPSQRIGQSSGAGSGGATKAAPCAVELFAAL